MAVYQIGDGQYELPDDISGDQLHAAIDHIAGLGQASSPSSSGSEGSWFDPIQHGAHSMLAGIDSTLGTHGADYVPDPKDYTDAGSKIIDAMHNGDVAGVASNLPRFAAEQIPQVAAGAGARGAGAAVGGAIAGPPGAAAGALIGPAAVGAVQTYGPALDARMKAQGKTRDDAALEDKAWATAASMIAGGADMLALRSVFGKSADSLVRNIALRGIPAGAISGATQSAATQVAQSADTPGGVSVDPAEVATGSLGGASGGAIEGAIGRVTGRSSAPPVPTASDAARARLAQRVQDEAKAQDYSLKDVDSAGQTARVLNNVHNSLAEEIKANAKALSDRIDPQQASSDDDYDARIQAQATLRDARNKVKSTASDDDIANLHNLVGDTTEGLRLIDAVHQSNHLTDLTNGGLIGGISRITDRANPLSMFTGGHGFAEKLAHGSGVGALGLGVLAHEPTVAAGGLAAAAGGRAIDAITGRRYPINKFVKDYAGKAQPLDTGSATSVLGTRRFQDDIQRQQQIRQAAADAAAQAAQQADQQRISQRATDLRAQRIRDNEPGLDGFDRMVYDKTGLRPQQARMGVLSLAQSGMVTPEEAAAWFHRPDTLQDGKVGLSMIDMLDSMARKGQLARAPEWQPAAPEASARPNPLQSAYEAQARGNQDRVTAAQGEVNKEGLDPATAQLINQTIGRIGKTNNRSDARAIHRDLQAALPDDATRAVAAHHIEPLITQIRHATREAAESVRPQPLETTAVKRDSRGRPIQRERLNPDGADLITKAMGDAAQARGMSPLDKLQRIAELAVQRHADEANDSVGGTFFRSKLGGTDKLLDAIGAKARSGDTSRNFEGPQAKLRPAATRLQADGDNPDRISPRLPTGKNATENPLTENLQVNLDALKASPKTFDKNMALVSEYPNYRPTAGANTPDKVAKRFVDHVADNLLWLHDQIPADIAARSRKWYDGAQHIAADWSGRYQMPDRAIGGVMAVLSPQKDWFQNVSLAERVLDIVKDHQETPWDAKMTETAARIYGKPQYKEQLAEITGKSLDQLHDLEHKAMWVRTYDEAHNDRGFRLVSPEGGFGDFVRTAKGAASKVAWSSNAAIAKAISIIENPTRENINSQLGTQHKVRSFYNNIIAPNAPHGDVTIDTHAVAAGLLRPLSGNALEVFHNFGNTPPIENGKSIQGSYSSAITGQQGLYGLYADAYRKAAAERGLLPREMQSITWEAVRGLFSPRFKGQEKNVQAVDDVWKRFRAGKVSLDDARKEVLALSGGIEPPDWVHGPGAGEHEASGRTSYQK